MRIHGTAAAAVSLALLAAGAARAQAWQEYSYPDAGFAAQFPAQPAVTDAPYKAGDVAGPAEVYEARLGSARYSVTVADLSASSAKGTDAIEAAVKALGALGQVKADVRERIDRQFGREVSVVGKDGGQITTAVFYVGKKLYVLAGMTEPDFSGLAVRFQQSLQFIDADGKAPRRPEDGGGGRGFGGRGFGPPPGEVAENHGVLGEGPAGEGSGNDGAGPPGGERGRRRRPPAQAFADCKGKAEGEAVQHQTPRGEVVAATCVTTPEGLAARPNRPLGPPQEGERQGG
jgi:hypothetical protein